MKYVTVFLKRSTKLLPGILQKERRSTMRLGAETLARFDRALLITGGAGFGKTSFCRWQTIRDGERFVRRASNVMPVYLALHQLAQGPLGGFREAFLPDPEFEALLQSSEATLRLYLDGLDE